eukprot:PITA_18073
MIVGYAKEGIFEEALSLFRKMQGGGVEPNQFKLASVLPTCADMVYLEQGMGIHQKMIVRGGFQSNVINGFVEEGMNLFEEMPQRSVMAWTTVIAGLAQNEHVDALIDMYAKCGSIQKARELFDNMTSPDVVSWNAMIAGYAMHDSGKEALKLFEQMRIFGIKPNHDSFVSSLSACSHAVNENSVH